MSIARTQCEAILAWLKEGNALTPLEALTKFGTLRLGARIYDLRGEGNKIDAKRITTPSGKSVAEYRLLR